MFNSRLRDDLAKAKTRLVISEFMFQALLDHLVDKGVLDSSDVRSLCRRARDLLEKAADEVIRRRREGREEPADAFLADVVADAFLQMADRAE